MRPIPRFDFPQAFNVDLEAVSEPDAEIVRANKMAEFVWQPEVPGEGVTKDRNLYPRPRYGVRPQPRARR